MSVDRTELDIRIIEYLYGEHDEPGVLRYALKSMQMICSETN